jgi:hypothetical protein
LRRPELDDIAFHQFDKQRMSAVFGIVSTTDVVQRGTDVNRDAFWSTESCRTIHVHHNVIETVGVDGLRLSGTGAGNIENLIG